MMMLSFTCSLWDLAMLERIIETLLELCFLEFECFSWVIKIVNSVRKSRTLVNILR
jgi:hypothetical protein